MKVITVKDLKKALEGMDDNLKVVLDVEGRCFNSHLVAVESISAPDYPYDYPESLCVIHPNLEGSYFDSK